MYLLLMMMRKFVAFFFSGFNSSIRKTLLPFVVLVVGLTISKTSIYAQSSEIGAWVGSSTYFGDLNTNFQWQYTRPAMGVLYRYNYHPYLHFRAGLSGGTVLHRDDASKNPFQEVRNLSFKTHIIELAGLVDLHFMKYSVGRGGHYFTPYLTDRKSVV